MGDRIGRGAPRVAVTRAPDDAAALAEALRRAGAEPVLTPLLRIVYADDAPLRLRLSAPISYDWLVVTSRHAVDAVAHVLGGTTPPALAGTRIGAVGRATAEALEALGMAADVVPAAADAAHLGVALVEAGAGAGSRVLFPRAREARAELPALLRAQGVEVDDVVCYDTHVSPEGGVALSRALDDGVLTTVSLASGSAARAFASTVTPGARARAHLVSIGPTTTAAALSCGLAIAGEATEASVDALARAATRLAHDTFTHA